MVTLASALSARPEASALLSEPQSSIPSAGKGRGGEVDPGPEVCRGWGTLGGPAPGLVLAGAEVQSLFCPQTSLGCPGSPALLSSSCQVGPPQQKGVAISLPGASISADAALARSLSALTP